MSGIDEGIRGVAQLYLNYKKEERQNLLDEVSFGISAMKALNSSVSTLPEGKKLEVLSTEIPKIRESFDNATLSPIYDSAISAIKARQTILDFAISEDKKLSNLTSEFAANPYSSSGIEGVLEGIKSMIGDFTDKGVKISDNMTNQLNNLNKSARASKGIISYLDSIDTNSDTPKIDFTDDTSSPNYVPEGVRPKLEFMRQQIVAGLPLPYISKMFAAISPKSASSNTSTSASASDKGEKASNKKISQELSQYFTTANSLRSEFNSGGLATLSVPQTSSGFDATINLVVDNISELIDSETSFFDLTSTVAKGANRTYRSAVSNGSPEDVQNSRRQLILSLFDTNTLSKIKDELGGKRARMLTLYMNSLEVLKDHGKLDGILNPPAVQQGQGVATQEVTPPAEKSTKITEAVGLPIVINQGNVSLIGAEAIANSLNNSMIDVARANTYLGNKVVNAGKNIASSVERRNEQARQEYFKKRLKLIKAGSINIGDTIKFYGRVYKYNGGNVVDITSWTEVK